jgi:putative transposase
MYSWRMPSRNSRKEYVNESLYHVYNRGVEKRTIFYDDSDYSTFLNLFKRYLVTGTSTDKYGRLFSHYEDVKLVAFCLMPNHYHLLASTDQDPAQLPKLMQSVGTAYSIYFNKRYKRVGHLFQERYKAVRITDDTYLHHISRYIHLNPKEWMTWQWSSLPYFLGNAKADWIHPEAVLELFESKAVYKSFVSDYESHKRILSQIKKMLADS